MRLRARRIAAMMLAQRGVRYHYYVNGATGNDTTGTGSLATPWKTISKALATVPIEGGVTIGLAAGTYAENTGGLNYLRILRLFLNWVTVRALPGATVKITDNGAAAYCVAYATDTGRVRFRDVTIEQAGAKTQSTVFLNNGAIADFVNCTITTCNWGVFSIPTATVNFSLAGCNITKRTGELGNIVGVYMAPAAAGNIIAKIINCTITGQGTAAQTPAVFALTNHATAALAITINGSTISSTGTYAVSCHGGSLAISGSAISSVTAPACVFGTDAANTYVTTGSITNCNIASGTSHALLIGQGCNAVSATYNNMTSGDYGIVCKKNTNCVLDHNTISGCSSAALYFKASVGTLARYNQLSSAAGLCAYLSADGAAKCQNITLTNNVLTATVAARCLLWPDATGDAGGGVCDYNQYGVSGTGNLGNVRAATNIANLAALQGAWAGYDQPNNDANSTVV